MPLTYNPLRDEHCAICNNILATIQEPMDVAQACIDCGFPAQDLLDNLKQIKEQATKIKQTFFPNRP